MKSREARVLALMVMSSTVLFIDRTAMSIVAPDIIRDLRISETAMGALFSSFYVTYTLFMLPGGWLSDRFGPRTTIGVGLLAAGAATALTGLVGMKDLVPITSAFTLLLIGRLCFGVASAPLYPACARLTANWFHSTTTARVQAVIFGITVFGSALLPIALTPVMRDFGWHNAFFILGGTTIAGAGVWYSFADNGPSGVRDERMQFAESTDSLPAAESVLMRRTVILLAASYGAFYYFVYLFESWTFYYYRQVRNFDSADSALYTSGMLMAGAVFMPIGGWISDRLTVRFGRSIGRRTVPIVGVIASVLLSIVGAAGLSPMVTAVALAVAYGFLVSGDPVYWAFTIEITGNHSGTATGMLNTAGNAAGIVTPIVSPWLAGLFGWDVAFYAAGFVACVGLLPLLFIRERQREPERIENR